MIFAPYGNRTKEGHLSSLGTISIKIERLHELRKNKEDVYKKVIDRYRSVGYLGGGIVPCPPLFLTLPFSKKEQS